MKRVRPILLASLALVLSAAPAAPLGARLRMPYDDEEVATRSEVIAVAHLKEGSVRCVVNPRRGDEGWSWEHHATLVVTDVLKGELKEREIPVTIHYGLDPVAGGKALYGGRYFHEWKDKTLVAVEPAPEGPIRIMDTANVSEELPIQDACEDNLWFLRKGIKGPGGREGAADLGIKDPEDVQPIALKDYFRAYLAPNPEPAVRDYAAQHGEVRDRAQRTFDHAEIARIAKLPDAAERAEKLMPYFVVKPDRLGWKTQQEAERAIVACGEAAGDALLKLFETADETRRQHILRMLGDIRYAPATDRLLALIAECEKFWDGYDVQQGWWNDDTRPLWHKSRQVYGEMQNAAVALEKIGDPRAKETLGRVNERLRKLAALMERAPQND